MMVAALSCEAWVGAGEPGDVSPGELERAFREVAERVSPSVVALRVERRTALAGGEGVPVSGPAEQVVIVNGAGVVIDAEGLIVTNEHVVQSADAIEAVFHDGERRRAEVVSSDARSDLAVVRVERRGLATVRFCEWEAVRRGQWAIVVGNPYGLGSDGQASLAVGVVSNLGRRLPGLGESDDRFYGNMIQTTAAINPGNSGGPLFNLRGEVVGIVTAMHVRAGQGDGVGFAIPMSPWKRALIGRLSRGERIEHGFMHASIRESLPAERKGVGVDRGVVVVYVDNETESPLRAGDLITDLDGHPVTSVSVATELIGCAPVGGTVAATVRRDGRPATVRVPIDRRSAARVESVRRATPGGT